MFRQIAFIASVFIASVFTALPAQANDRPTSERVTDGLGFAASSGLLMVGGGLGGLFVGAAVCEDNDVLLGCLGPAILGMGIGGLMGGVGGGLIFDGLSDGDGSLWGAAGGAGLGLLGGIGLATLVDDNHFAFAMGSIILGSGLGYALVDSTSVAPVVTVVPDGQGGRRSTFGLSGRF